MCFKIFTNLTYIEISLHTKDPKVFSTLVFFPFLFILFIYLFQSTKLKMTPFSLQAQYVKCSVPLKILGKYILERSEDSVLQYYSIL